MTQTRAEHLKKEFCGQFSEVFELCRFVMVTIFYYKFYRFKVLLQNKNFLGKFSKCSIDRSYIGNLFEIFELDSIGICV